MGFQSNFPTNDSLKYGINQVRLNEISSSVDSTERNDIWVIVEIDKKNNNAIKNVEVVRGNLFERVVTVITKFIEELREGKTYHYGKGAMLRDLSSHLDKMSREYEKLAKSDPLNPDEVQTILDVDENFNSTIRTITEISNRLFDSTGQTEIRNKADCLYFNHDLAINHFTSKQIARSLLTSKNQEKDALALVEARKRLHSIRQVGLTDMQKEDLRIVIEKSNKDIVDYDIMNLLVSLVRENKIDAARLALETHTDDPLKHIAKLAELKGHLETMQSEKTSDLEYVTAGISFIQDFYALPSETQKLSGLKEEFDHLKFNEACTKRLEALKTEVESFNADPENMVDFAKKFESFVNIMKGLNDARTKIKQGDSKNSESELMQRIQEDLDRTSEEIGAKLSFVRVKQLEFLQAKYAEKSRSVSEELDALKITLAELEGAQADSKLLAQIHNELVFTIRSGDGTDIASMLTVPSDDYDHPEIKALVFALQALVKQARLQDSDLKHQEERLPKLDKHLKEAGLPEIGKRESAIDYLQRPQVVEKVKSAAHQVEELKRNAEEKLSSESARVRAARDEADKTKNARIASQKNELNNIALIEIRLLRKKLGMTTLTTNNPKDRDQELSVKIDEINRQISPNHLTSEDAEKRAEEILSDFLSSIQGFYKQRDHLHKLVESSLEKNQAIHPELKYQMALYVIARDMLERRDALQKEIAEFDKLLYPEYYSASTEKLARLLDQIKEEYGFSNDNITIGVVNEKAEELKMAKKDSSLLSNQALYIVELAQAYKYRKHLDEIAQIREKDAGRALAAVTGWGLLAKGLDHLLRTQASYTKSEEASQKANDLGAAAKKAKNSQTSLQERQELIDARQKELSRLLDAQVDLLQAQAAAGMLEQIDLFQQDQQK